MIRIEKLYDDIPDAIESAHLDKSKLQASRRVVEEALTNGNTYYGINTGFGPLARIRVPNEDLALLQRNLLLSHAVGVGPYIPRGITEIMLALKIKALALGYSGISETTFDRLVLLFQRGLIPAVPQKGSVGASGDLAPLAHLCLPLIGEGEVWDESGERVRPAARALQEAGLAPIELEPKDGLALINGTQMMSAYGVYALHRALNLLKAADIIAAMSIDGMMGSLDPFDDRIHRVRPHPGQLAVARNIRTVLAESEILLSHERCSKVQDQYSLRCVPQVHGASRDALAYANRVVETEVNSVTDNPLVFPEGDIISGGNFHGQPLALALDFAAMAIAELGSISERRTYLLSLGSDGLPTLLTANPGTNSGFMILQYTAAALVSQNKVLCHPASVDSIPTSLGQEDHVSMGSISAVKLLEVLENTEQVLAIELMSAAQALDFRAPLVSGRGAAAAHAAVRARAKHVDADRLYQSDLRSCLELLRSGELVRVVEGEVGALQ